MKNGLCDGCGAPLVLHRRDCEYCRRIHSEEPRFRPEDYQRGLAQQLAAQQTSGDYFNRMMQNSYGSQNNLQSLLGGGQYNPGWMDPRSVY
jgi:hypothetical protein